MRVRDIETAHVLTVLTRCTGLKLTEQDRQQGITTDTILAAIQSLAQIQVNGETTRFIVGQHHIRIQEIVWDLTVAMLSLLPAAVSPTGITQTVAAATVLKALISIKQKITNLNDEQLEICRAVALIVKRKSTEGRIIEIPYAELSEVQSELHSRGIDVPDLHPMLDDLTPRILKRVFYSGHGPFYGLT